mmetsp:Transcript_19672/g.54934  ORF Transcript_19672/g.54934 Transcript_19672/m.54934 type:complete len:88 (+) Transcript_19672:164-427(+)
MYNSRNAIPSIELIGTPQTLPIRVFFNEGGQEFFMSLNGQIPSQIGSLTKLRHIDLSKYDTTSHSRFHFLVSFSLIKSAATKCLCFI